MKKIKKILSYTVFWLIQCTWGIIMTLIGAVVALGLILTGHKPKRMGPAIYFEVGENWGGLSLGGFFLCSRNASEKTKEHEFGHTIQNLILGPFMPFLIVIPSAARYWLFQLNTPLKRAIYVSLLLLATLALSTMGAAIFALIGGFKIIVILFEILRLYFVLMVLWLNIFELPNFTECSRPEYNKAWFENWASKIGEKKED